MKVLVTGGSGFIGSHIAEGLLETGAEVSIFDNFSTGRRENIAPFERRIRVFEGDLQDAQAVQKATQGMDIVFHIGALPSVPKSFEQPILTNSVNVGGTINVLEGARRNGVKRVIYAASSSAYGNAEALQKDENLAPNPLSPYALQKLSGEYYCRYYWETFKVPTIALRYFNVFGPRQDPNGPYSAVIAKFIKMGLDGQAPLIDGDGSQTRDFTYISNIVYANLLALNAPEKAFGRVMNTACGNSYSVLNVWEQVQRVLKVDLTPQFGPTRMGDVKHSLANNSLAKELIGYEPQVSFSVGMERTIASYQKGQA